MPLHLLSSTFHTHLHALLRPLFHHRLCSPYFTTPTNSTAITFRATTINQLLLLNVTNKPVTASSSPQHHPSTFPSSSSAVSTNKSPTTATSLNLHHLTNHKTSSRFPPKPTVQTPTPTNYTTKHPRHHPLNLITLQPTTFVVLTNDLHAIDPTGNSLSSSTLTSSASRLLQHSSPSTLLRHENLNSTKLHCSSSCTTDATFRVQTTK